MDNQALICERLKKIGFAGERHIKLYGEKLRLVSDPIPDGAGFAVEAIAVRSGDLRCIRIPLPVAEMLERELGIKRQADKQPPVAFAA